MATTDPADHGREWELVVVQDKPASTGISFDPRMAVATLMVLAATVFAGLSALAALNAVRHWSYNLGPLAVDSCQSALAWFAASCLVILGTVVLLRRHPANP